MKRTFLLILFTLSLNIGLCQSVVIQSISRATQVIGGNIPNMKSYLKASGYEFLSKSNNMLTYYKNFEGITYTLTIAIRNEAVSALSGEELINNSTYLRTELSNLGFVMNTNSTIGSQAIRSYHNIKRNLMVTLIQSEGVIKITMGIKDLNKPYNAHTSNGTANSKNGFTIVSITLSPKDNDSRVLSKPDSKFIHGDFEGGQIGLSWTFKAKKKIINGQGIFFEGDILTPRGTAQPNKPYYILASEWTEL